MARWDAGSWTGRWLAQPVPVTDDCILWPFALDGRGYAVLRTNSDGKVRKVSHIMLERFGQPRPTGLFALHSCDNRACVNPKHLSWGTHQENMRQMVERGRWAGIRQTPPTSTTTQKEN